MITVHNTRNHFKRLQPFLEWPLCLFTCWLLAKGAIIPGLRCSVSEL